MADKLGRVVGTNLAESAHNDKSFFAKYCRPVRELGNQRGTKNGPFGGGISRRGLPVAAGALGAAVLFVRKKNRGRAEDDWERLAGERPKTEAAAAGGL